MSGTPDEYGQWKHKPHVRFGDPCFDCGVPLAPASRRWCAETVPPGVKVHSGHNLCSSCAKKRDRDMPGWRREIADQEDDRG